MTWENLVNYRALWSIYLDFGNRDERGGTAGPLLNLSFHFGRYHPTVPSIFVQTPARKWRLLDESCRIKHPAHIRFRQIFQPRWRRLSCHAAHVPIVFPHSHFAVFDAVH